MGPYKIADAQAFSSNFGKYDSQKLLTWAINRFGDKLAIVTSFQKSGIIILHMALKICHNLRIITIDTGRLHNETYSFIETVKEFFETDIEIIFPEKSDIEKMVSQFGVNLFYRNPAARIMCCNYRKVEPLKKALEGSRAWISGLRRTNSVSRENIDLIQPDPANRNLIKINPLAYWTDAEVDAYYEKYKLPLHPLYKQGYQSIGCSPCTRPVSDAEHQRAGRWWWENCSIKECGLHFNHNQKYMLKKG